MLVSLEETTKEVRKLKLRVFEQREEIMGLRVGSLAHFQRFLEKGHAPWEYAKRYEMSEEFVDELQERRLSKIRKEARNDLSGIFPLVAFDKIDDDWFPAPGFETSEIKPEKTNE